MLWEQTVFVYVEGLLAGDVVLWRSSDTAGGLLVPADGCVDLIVRDDRVDIAGPSTRWLTTEPGGVAGTTGLRLPPGRAARLLPMDLSEIADRVVPIEELLDGRTRVRLRDAALRLATPGEPRDVLRPEFRDLILRDPPRAWSAHVRDSASRAVPASEVLGALDMSQRTFRRRMTSTFGYGYATLIRIERAKSARRLLQSGSSPAAVAAGVGYSDQSHLSREFRRLVGITPANYASSGA